ncbi:UNVERIFIED_CONTAM: hypothetical protein K2H54_004564 [Gekko kuhli]
MVIRHVETPNSFPVLKVDRSDLSLVGLDLFLEDIKDTVRAHVLQSSGGFKEGGNVSPLAPLVDSASLVFMRREVAVQGDHMVSSSKEVSQETRNDLLSPKPRVWICGGSTVISAQERASGTAAGSQLGLEQRAILEWHGQEKLAWIQVLPFLQYLGAWYQAPDVLIIHLEREDLVRAYDLELADRVTTEWSFLRTLFPGVRVIWSELIPPVFQPGLVDFKRRLMNTLMRKAMKTQSGDVVKHPTIISENRKLYLDKANLSPAGLDIFLEDIKIGILAHLPRSGRATGAVLQEGRSLPPPASPAAPAGFNSVSHQEAATREDKAVSSTEEASSMQTSTGEAAVSSQPGSSKAEKAGAASPSLHPGTSGTRKAENSDVEPKLAFGHAPLCSGCAGHPSKPRVWICGHALVNAAQERAAATSKGSQLGLENKIVLEWHGQDGLMWVRLVPFLQDLAAYHWTPDMLIIHIGENDLMNGLYVSFLIKTIQRELFLVKELFPKVTVVWSEMTPWGSWPGLLPCAADKDEPLKKVNLSVANDSRWPHLCESEDCSTGGQNRLVYQGNISPQTGTPGICKAQNMKPKLVLGSFPPRPARAAAAAICSPTEPAERRWARVEARDSEDGFLNKKDLGSAAVLPAAKINDSGTFVACAHCWL